MVKPEPLTVLYAEDEPGDRIPYADYLRAKGIQVIEATTPEGTMKCLELHPDRVRIDLVVLDLVMPAGDIDGGRKVLAFMQKHGIMVPVLLATAWGFNGPAKRAKDAYPDVVATRIMTKPFAPVDLHKAVTDVVKEWSKRKKGAKSSA